MPLRSPQSEVPKVKVSPRGATRLKSGHVWVYRSDILSADGVQPGSLVAVTDQRGKPLGTALYSSTSQIAIRLISPDPVADLPALLRQRLESAIDYRQTLVRDTDAYRVIFSEADFLPGLIVDRYNDILSLQILTQAMDASPVRDTVISHLAQGFRPASIVERTDPRVRELESLAPRASALLYGERSATTFTMNSVRFNFDALSGQKTGAFLDQRENYAAAAKYAHGEAMDVFTYQGGFALHLARSCDSVIGVDASREALETAEKNESLNSLPKPVEWLEANSFDLLKDWASGGRQFDTIVLDPPAFAKSHKDHGAALRGYKEINLRALKMLREGGVLVTCSCSQHIGEADFIDMLREAASDARRLARVLEKRGQAKDH